MATTRYFSEQVLRKRLYLTEGMCREVLARPLLEEEQSDGRIRVWGRSPIRATGLCEFCA